MLALWFWLAYLVLAFAVAPAVFRLRYGRWPYAYAVQRPDAYLWIDFAYGAVTIAFTVCLLFNSQRDGGFPIAGVVLGTLASLLIAWTQVALGQSWRIGQDRTETGIAQVTSGPYRLMRHPMYVGLTLLALAMLLMAGPTACTITFACATPLYSLIQGWNENRRWRVQFGAT